MTILKTCKKENCKTITPFYDIQTKIISIFEAITLEQLAKQIRVIIMNYLEHLISNKVVFFNFMKKRYPLFQQSNLFFRDMQYAIMSYFELKEKPLTYEKAEVLAQNFIKKLVDNDELLELDHKTWKVNFEVEEKQNAETVRKELKNE